MKPTKTQLFTQGAIAMAVALTLQPQALQANPTGAQVVNGTVNITQPNASTLNIQNSPGSIINWQGFSIRAGELTNFSQQSASSAVLNRVVGGNISSIYGQLTSNGRVFLINPAGLIVGPGGSIDTAGFVGSTLNMSNADFLAGKLRFSGDANSGTIINQGWIRTPFGGSVLLVAPRIENSGLIQTPGGELILAAGQKLTVGSVEHEGVQFEVQAPTDTVVNVGKLFADGGALGVFAGSIKHSGDIRANALIRDQGGNIVLKAANDIQIAAGSSTSASGRVGGTITIDSAAGHSRVAGNVLATGSQGKGGGITIVGERVTATDGALIDASGATGGGQILLGGDYQGANAAVRNATTTFVGGNATLRADATDNGDGGRIIVWGNENTRFFGSLSAQGGPQGGNGGFAEVSGAKNLIFEGTANLGARAEGGALGTLLLDPLDLYVVNNGGVDSATGGFRTSTIVDETTDFPSSAVTISPTTLAGIVGNVNLYASRYLRIGNDINLTRPGQSLTATVGTYAAPALPDPTALDTVTPNRLEIGTDIATGLGININTAGGAVTLRAPLIQGITTSKISTNGGAISLTSDSSIAGNALSLDAASGAVNLQAGGSGSISLGGVTGNSVTATAPSSVSLGNVAIGSGALALTSTGSSVSVSSITSAGGAIGINSLNASISTGNITGSGGAINMSALNSSISTGNIIGGGGAVSLQSRSGIFTGIIDTTNLVNLSVTGGNINTTINNSSGVTASSANSFSSTSININSTTTLNANSITATAVNCSSSFSCPGANINLTSTGDINVGAIAANAPATTNNASIFANSISRSVTVTSNGGSILAASPASSITATDVTLNTQALSLGRIGTPGAALNVNAERLLSMSANGDFNVLATGAGPTQLNAQIGIAPTGKTYAGTLNSSSGGLTLNATATDTTVTVSNLNATSTRFTQRLYNSNPFITLNTPSGALTVTNATVSEGDTRPNDPPLTFPFYNTAALPVTISASGALNVGTYTRQSTGASLPKSTSFSGSTVTLGTIVAGKDAVTVSAGSTIGSNVSITDLTTAGNVTVTTSGGDITVGRIDTTSGTGSVSLTASTATGNIKALTDTGALEITAGGSISATARTIGTSGFVNPLDVAGTSVTLTSNNATGGAIGFAGAPIIANTQSLTLNASQTTTAPTLNGASFNVNTGAIALTNLNVTASAQAVGVGGPGTVTTEGGANTYNFVSDGANFTFNPGTASANQFVNGTLGFTSNAGNINLGATNVGTTGSLSVTARNGSILGGSALDAGGSIALSAGASVGGPAVAVTVGNIGAINRPNSLSMSSGNGSFFSPTFTQRVGTVNTGNIEAGSVSVNAFNGNITLGNIGATTRAGAVSVTASPHGSSYGKVLTGTITAGSLSINDERNDITTGNLDVTSGIQAVSQNVVTLGNVTAQDLTVTCSFSSCTRPQLTTGAINGVKSMSLFARATTINGSVTGDPTGTGQLFIGGSSGAVNIVGGSVTAGNGSTIAIDAQDSTNPFIFATLNAGAAGTVSVLNPGGIRETGGAGITGATVTLTASGAGKPISRTDGDFKLDINGVGALTINAGGAVAIDANGSTLNSLTIAKTQTPGAAAFDLSNLGGGQVVTLAGAADLALNVSSVATPLNFNLNYSAGKAALTGTGIATGGGNVNLAVGGGTLDASVGGINTSGGSVTVTSAGFNATGGGVSTGGATGGGSVNITSNGQLTAGAITTAPTGTGTGGAITLTASSGGLLVNGNLTTGTAGGSIALSSSNAAITTSGGATITSDTSVSVTASNADIGTGGAPLLITSPTATLTATGTTVGGNVFATLTNTTALNLSGDNGFNVASNTGFNTLSVATRGTRSGTMTLTAPGQTYSFARPTTDLFGGAMTNTFQVVAAAGATPATSATFTATDGDLFVGGVGTSLTTAALTLGASSTGDVKLQGTAANPLALTNATQNIGTSSTRDTLIRGVVALNATTQNITASRSITTQAEQGVIAYTGVDQAIVSTGFSGGAISFKGGVAANETVTVTASNTQLIQSPNSASSAAIRFEGGDGAGSSTTLVYTGTGTQRVQGGGNVSIKGGIGAGAIAEIRTATGSQFVSSASNVDVTGGAGAGAAARIVNTGTGTQQIGESSIFLAYRPISVTVAAGAGNDAIAEITASGAQSVFANAGTLAVLGGAGTNSFARIDSTSAAQQLIGCTVFTSNCGRIGTLNLLAGAGDGAYSRLTNTGSQTITATSAINLTGSAAVGASASMIGGGQTLRGGNMTLTAGAGNNSGASVVSSASQSFTGNALTLAAGAGAASAAQMFAAATQSISAGTTTLLGGAGTNALAQIVATGAQTFGVSSVTMTGGAGAGAYTQVASTGASQSLNVGTLNMTGGAGVGSLAQIVASTTQNISGNNMTLTGGGTTAIPVANSYALIQGNSQSVSASNLTLNGGNGAAGNNSDAILRNLSGNQTVNASNVALNSGTLFSTTGILNQGAGTQSVTSSNNIILTAAAGTNNNTSVQIQNAQATQQTLSATNGIGILNQGTGALSVSSGGAQRLTSRFVEVSTGAGSTGNAILAAGGNQWIRTTDGSVTRAAPFSTSKQSMLVTALGSGTAQVESGASQLLQLDYPDQMQAVRDGALVIGGATAAGVSRVGAVDQTLFVKSLNVQAGTSGRAELKASNKQVVSVLNGNLTVLGGSGANTVAQIDPVDQTLLVNGAVIVQGGSGSNAVAQINSAGTQTVLATKGGITVAAGSGAGAHALITAGGDQTISATGAVLISGGTIGALARIATSANQTFIFGNLTMTGGPGAGSAVEVTAGGTQTLTGGDVTITGGGTSTPVAGASATIQGGSQVITANNLLLTGGNGSAGGNSDAVVRSVTGSQLISAASGVTLNGGTQFSTTGIINQGAGTQTVSTGGGLFLNTALNAGGNTSVLIQNAAATTQSLGAGSGFGLVNRGFGLASVSSGGDQGLTARFVDVVTRAGTAGDAIVSAAGNQTIHTTDGRSSSSGSLRVTAFGVGKANIESGANQSLFVDYPEQTFSSLIDGRLTVGDVAASGLSRIGAVNQNIFAKSMLVQTGNTGSRSEIKSSNVQTIQVLNGNLDVRGGAGDNTLAQIDPINQNIVVNGNINVVGGTGTNAIAQVVSAGTQNITANSIFVTGGSGVGALAAITAVGLQTLIGEVVKTDNVGGAKVAGGTGLISSIVGGASTGNVLAGLGTQSGVIAGLEPDEQDQDEPVRRAPICF